MLGISWLFLMLLLQDFAVFCNDYEPKYPERIRNQN
ncbi:hypothetical protein BMF77_pc00019 (plasmid) [Dolichospermum sp. UHCC 0315A]|nr:hypothetical protein BMF77_pc00019 [Dolichospermum sp. UHCC 0315A]